MCHTEGVTWNDELIKLVVLVLQPSTLLVWFSVSALMEQQAALLNLQ